MKVLVFGGNRFFGKRLVELLAEAGHEVTVVNRGHLPTAQQQGVEWIRGDRNDEVFLQELASRKIWDVIYDQSCYRASQALKMRVFYSRVGRYIFTSTVSVYSPQDFLTEADFDPSSYSWSDQEESESYDENKRRSEVLIQRQFENSVLVRFSAVLGPADYTRRLIWHLQTLRWRMPIFSPHFDVKFSVIHQEDAARALMDLLDSPLTGPVNVCAEEPVHFQDLNRMIEEQVGDSITWVDRASRGAQSPLVAPYSQVYDVTKWKSAHIAPRNPGLWLRELIEQQDRQLQEELARFPLRVAKQGKSSGPKSCRQGLDFNTKAVVNEEPFRHLLIENFLSPANYEALCDQMAEQLAWTQVSRQDGSRFLKASAKYPKSQENYQALISRWMPNIESPAAFFYSRDFFNFLQSFFDVPFAPEMSGSFHHHFKGNDSGWIHSDFNLMNFPLLENESGLNPFDPNIQSNIQPMCRSVAILYYFHNPDWVEGFGGETGLWRRPRGEPEKKYAPLNNRLIAFEISPRSYHSFLRNAGGARNCIAYWFHSDPRWMRLRYGVEPLSGNS